MQKDNYYTRDISDTAKVESRMRNKILHYTQTVERSEWDYGSTWAEQIETMHLKLVHLLL